MRDVNLSVDNDRFNYRVAAHISCKGSLLLQKADYVDFYNLPGGRVKFQESTKEAIIRELKEELGIEIDNPNLIAVAENFFTWAGQNVQELVFIYEIKLDDSYYEKLDHFKNMDSECEYMYWAKIDNLKALDIRPTLIYNLPSLDRTKINHIIHK